MGRAVDRVPCRAQRGIGRLLAVGATTETLRTGRPVARVRSPGAQGSQRVVAAARVRDGRTAKRSAPGDGRSGLEVASTGSPAMPEEPVASRGLPCAQEWPRRWAWPASLSRRGAFHAPWAGVSIAALCRRTCKSGRLPKVRKQRGAGAHLGFDAERCEGGDFKSRGAVRKERN